MRTFIHKTREELSKIWEDCLYGIQQQREFSAAFEDGPYDDDLLSAHESELDRMRGFYQDNLEVFKLVQKREDLFKQHLELEVRKCVWTCMCAHALAYQSRKLCCH